MADLVMINTLNRSVEHCYPKILNAALEQEISVANVKKNESPFDTRVLANTAQRQGSTYNTEYERVGLEKRIYGSPMSVYTGYDISSGYAPQYEGAQITATEGREFIGVKFNLLNGFTIDKERIDLYNAILDKNRASYEVKLAKLLVKTDAIKSYLTWVTAGIELKSYQKLLALAEKRQAALEKRLQEGDVAEISVKENYNTILKRRMKVMSAENYFNQASQDLSLYYRNTACQMVVPEEQALPDHLPPKKTLPTLNFMEEMKIAMQNRPEFQIIQTQINQILNEQKLAKTELLPKLNVLLQYNKNNSGTATTPDFLINENEYLAKLELSIPLEQSYGSGLSTEATKKLRQLQNEKQWLMDQLRSRINTLRYTVNNTSNQASLAKSELSLSGDLLAAENKRINNGDSNFFMLNIREENQTNSTINMINAITQNYQAFIEYNFLNGKNVDLEKTY
jgi:outer membrane protein TolC